MKSPRFNARIAGIAYLVIFLAAPFSEFFVRSGVIVRGDAAATANNILAAETLWRFGYVAEFATATCDIIVAVLLYELLKPAGKTGAMLAAAFRLITVAITAPKALLHLAPLYLLDGGDVMSAFPTEQLQALSYMSLRLHGEAYDVALFYFGIHCLLIGWLIARATFMPRIIGWLLALAGLCYIFNTVAGALAPEFARGLFPWILLPALPAEGGLTLWLLIMGVNADKWRGQEAAAEARA
ncbi:MAG: DUF4386 domain-containing protein [Hyphomonadaceae bacterium]